jgi:two-component system sensor histidine kinase UhpB
MIFHVIDSLMSLQLKLNLMITCLLVLMLGASAFFIIDNARDDVRAEVESTSSLVLHLLDTEIMHFTSDYGWLENNNIRNEKTDNRFFRLSSLGSIRHLKIDFYDMNGMLRETNQTKTYTDNNQAPPTWFTRLIGLSDIGVNVKRKRIVINGRFVGELVVTPDPSYEIAEVWSDTVGLLGMVLIFFILMNLLVYWAVKYTFKPVSKILTGLTHIEEGEYAARLPEFKQIELQAIGAKFNAMADTLQQSIRNNHRLAQQLIRLQEDERKSLARDIHDEIGQYLTAIHVDASAILKAKNVKTAKESAQAISDVARQMMDIVHELLRRLRPRALDELGTGLALGELIQHWRQRNRNVSVIHKVSQDIGVIDDSVAITTYRVVQECLTNIAKHANATRVKINVEQDDLKIYINIEDNGVGFDQKLMTNGYGLAGMRERVQGLFGDMKITSDKTQGTKMHVSLPKHSQLHDT